MHENSKYPCEVCSLTFNAKADLRGHNRRVHQKLKPHKCEPCDKQFACLATLKSHIKYVHKNEKEGTNL